jgi:hypothetical protein
MTLSEGESEGGLVIIKRELCIEDPLHLSLSLSPSSPWFLGDSDLGLGSGC